MLHAVLVTLKECGETGTIIHDKNATLGALCGNAAVSKGQEELRNRGTAAVSEGGQPPHTLSPSPGPVGHPGSPDSAGLCLASQT